MQSGDKITVLHYTGYSRVGGGIVAVIRALAREHRCRCVHGVAHDYTGEATTDLEIWSGPAIEGEAINPVNLLRAFKVARRVRDWLGLNPGRVFHGHSRAGMLVGLWLHWMGEKRFVVSVHCYGRQRWFYRWAARQLGGRLFWLSPAMRIYYGAPGSGWTQCVPGGVPAEENGQAPAEPQPERLRLGGAGAFVRWKRWELVVAAIKLLPEDLRRLISFEHIGGAGSDAARAYARELQALAAAAGVAEQIRWRGAEPSSASLLAQIDVLLITSHQEPCAMTMFEALAKGVPVLAADTGGAVDFIREGENGWFFASGNAVDLANRLTWLFTTQAWSRLDRGAIRRSTMSATDVAARWHEVYAALPNMERSTE